MGLALYHMNQCEEAIKHYDIAIECVNGTNAENFFNRGNVHLREENFRQAHADFDKAISLDGF